MFIAPSTNLSKFAAENTAYYKSAENQELRSGISFVDVSGCLITQLPLTETRDVKKRHLSFLYAFLQF